MLIICLHTEVGDGLKQTRMDYWANWHYVTKKWKKGIKYMLDQSLESEQSKELGHSLLVNAWDKQDVKSFVGHFAKDGVWVVNSSEPAKGHEQISDLTKSLMGIATGSRHYDLNGFSSDDKKKVIVSGKVDYSVKGNLTVTCTFCDVFELNEHGLIEHAETFMDTSPLS